LFSKPKNLSFLKPCIYLINYGVVFHSPEYIPALQAQLSPAIAWNATRRRQMGANAMDTLDPRKQKVSSNKPFTRSNSGPINNVPAAKATPHHMNICDISSVLLAVQTSMSGSAVVIIPRLAPYDHTTTSQSSS